jgi:hypothetical protein
MDNAEIIRDLTRHFGEGNFSPLPGRGNSRVGTWTSNQRSFVKIYPDDGTWDRRATEKRVLEHYSRNGITAIPRILHSDAALNYSVFSYIDGTPAYTLTADLFNQIQAFLRSLMTLPCVDGYTHPAKEAFFHTSELKAHINQRLAALRAIDDPLLQDYLHRRIDAYFAEVGYDRFQDVSCGERVIISPSDFGTHNSMLAPDGKLSFIDFEYAGRDSMFKLLGDIYWHPGSSLSLAQRISLITPYLLTSQDQTIFRNVRLLMGLKWSLLLLNEFIPFNLRKRIVAGAEPVDSQNVKQQQIEKSVRILEKVTSDWQGKIKEFGFP